MRSDQGGWGHHCLGTRRVRAHQAGNRRGERRCGVGTTTLVGPGDDAAVVATADGRVVASTDLLIENRHFRRDWSSANDIGHKAAARNFADIVAMGAVPTALLVGFAGPGLAGRRMGRRPRHRHARGVRRRGCRGRRRRRHRGRPRDARHHRTRRPAGPRTRSRSTAPRSATSSRSPDGSAGRRPASPFSDGGSARRCRSCPRTAVPNRRTRRARSRPISARRR